MKSEHITPSVPRPPHDPTWWLLNARIGWHEADLQHVEKQPPTHMLALAPQSGRGRSLTEASGSFGGLTVPSNVSLDPDGSIYLLDLKTVELKRFDPCECLFQTVPCFGGTGRGPRQLYDPHGIGIYGNNLFVCDTGNHRLSIFSLHGFVLRAMWRPPSTAGLTNDWEPYAVAFDRRGHVYVTDGANGYIHHFNCSGRWLDPLPGFGKATHITSDCRDSLYVVVEGTMDSVRVVAGDGADLGAVSRPEALGENFPRLPFRVDPGGASPS